MAALLEWGAERGATTAYLQVLGHNAPALALYEAMGFTTHHAYAYLTPARERQAGATAPGSLAFRSTPVRPDNPRSIREAGVRASGVPTRGR